MNTTTNGVVIQRLDFHHQCADLSNIHARLDVIVFVQIIMCIALLWLIRRQKKMSPSCPQSNEK